MNQVFYAHRSAGSLFGIGIGFLIIFLSIGLPLLMSTEQEMSWNWGLLIPGIIALFFVYVLVASTFKLFVQYRVGVNGITIIKPPVHRRVILKEEIESVEYLNTEDASSFVAASIQEQNSYADSSDIVGYIRMLRAEFPAYKYYTMSPTAAVSSVGPKERITSLSVRSPGGMIVLRLRNSEEFFLTPRNPEAFKMAVDSILTLKADT